MEMALGIMGWKPFSFRALISSIADRPGGLAAFGGLISVASGCIGVYSSASYYFGYLRKAPPLVVISSQVRSVIANLLVCIARHLHSFPY